MNLVFATHNPHKIKEVSDILRIYANNIKILSLEDINCNEEIPEEGNTLNENALQKANYIYNKYHLPCFADDTGLEVEALNGAPGVFSARYAGEHKSFRDNNIKLLSELKNITNRKAHFKTVIAFIFNNKHFFFEGIVEGYITNNERGI